MYWSPSESLEIANLSVGLRTLTMRKGQGLLETIVAIGIMMTGLISVMSLVISNLNSQREAATRYQAVNLAREAIELVRNTRDSNWLAGSDTWAGMQTTVATVSGPLPSPFEGFTRTVTMASRTCAQAFPAPDTTCAGIEPDARNNVAQEITATVNWNLSGRQKTITLTDTLYDWK